MSDEEKTAAELAQSYGLDTHIVERLGAVTTMKEATGRAAALVKQKVVVTAERNPEAVIPEGAVIHKSTKDTHQR